MKGDYVSLRRMKDADFELLADWIGGRVGSYGAGSPFFVTPEELRRGADTYLMVVRNDGERIGVVSWRQLAYVGSYELGVAIGDESAWTDGYGVEAVLLLLHYVFHARNAHRVEMKAGLFNRQPIRMVTQGIMVLEGVLRDYYFLDGRYYDAVVFSLLREDYYKLVEALELSPDTIPEAEKREAFKVFQEFLANRPQDYLSQLLNRKIED
ncbi:alanine acetyltransferase [Actinomadura sp. NBRC 104412]|uniref:GNAT family N-acetyltransferase n=1 Tax=Actinomadura sp. NBRC 104412 TaxID=3032203 RepID=UPI0024A4C022|nr:GNAT family protein [Actinomadura sp. NBRC 104412]GLZ06506.1 alanine acetyltransferase [Actinomadura sp. NBRC 104412]